ncbi:ER membrane protein complex subunit 8 isoform X1 [Rhincodon typus]|uniref:ER membrane protein complex subunit 8 isoform X1 n=1 Tax=Rhincodon typus TaxID=259920 RepID=UPI0020301F82|nr:ER membrane protein complex subunit 8 isoform X1 [Rhincodon typus]
MTLFRLTTQAYCKMLLHAAKYPHCAVNGILVAEKHKRKDGQPVLFVDCVPLFHGTLALAPMLEVALTLVDSWCKENNYVIAGYYQANERMMDTSPNQVAEKVASRIAENFSDAALIMVDNHKFTMECEEQSIIVYEHHENKWRCKDPNMEENWLVLGHFNLNFDSMKRETPSSGITGFDFCEDWSEVQRITNCLLDGKSYDSLVDFDNHMDDLRNDWTNPEINKAVLHLC